MKKIHTLLFSFVFVSAYCQTPKMEVIVGSTENIDGISAEIKQLNPMVMRSAISGRNRSQTYLGYGILGTHDGSGTGVYGTSTNGIGVVGNSANLIGMQGLSIHGIGGHFKSYNGNAGKFESVNGAAGNFNSQNSYALVTDNGKVGFGTTTPTKAFLVVDKKLGATHAIFGENTSGVAIESDFPGISFNGYWNGGRKPLSNGFVGGMGMNPSTGLITIYNTYSSGTAGNNVTTQDVIAMDFDGKVGIGNSNPQAKLHITGGNVRIDAMSGGTGYRKVLVDAQGTITNDSPVAFSANISGGSATLGHNSSIVVPFDAIDYNYGSFYNSSNYEFNAPTNGLYHFDCTVTFGSISNISITNPEFIVSLKVDGTTKATSSQQIAIGGWKAINLSTDLKLNAGQKVTISAFQNSGYSSYITGYGVNTKFNGRLVERL